MRVAPHPCPCQILYHYRPPSPPRRLSIAHNSRQETCESRRDCIVQPRVARHELPWEDHVKSASTPTGLHRCCPRVNTTPLGLTGYSTILTQDRKGVSGLGAARRAFYLGRNDSEAQPAKYAKYGKSVANMAV